MALLTVGGCGEAVTEPPLPATPPAEDTPLDLNAGWIERLPRIAYQWSPGDPPEAGWPAVGQEITWRAHVRSWSDTTVSAVPYRWILDGAEVERGTVDLAAGEHAEVDLAWNWSFDRHELEFVLDPDDEFAEVSEFNNQIEILTNALSVGFWVEQGAYDFLHRTQSRLRGRGSNSFEDWAQRQIRVYNQILGARTYPAAPEGVRDRVRLDLIKIVPDGTLTNLWTPEVDLTIDASWGFPTRPIPGGLDVLQQLVVTNDPTRFSPFVEHRVLFHEMMHQRGLTDLYAYQVFHGRGGNGSWIDVRENGEIVAGSQLMPATASFGADQIQVYERPVPGLMEQDFTFVSLHSALGLNLIAGRRTPWALEFGDRFTAGFQGYLLDLPAQNRVTLVDSVGAPLSGADVRAFQDTEIVNTYRNTYDSIPDLFLTADAAGRIDLGRNPFGPTLAPDLSIGLRAKPTALILRVEYEGRVAYEFLPAYLFNIEYWRGNVDLGTYELPVRFRTP